MATAKPSSPNGVPTPHAPEVVLRLYVSGDAPNSVRAIANVKAICGEHFAARHQLEIIDLLWHSRRAFADGVIVTPMLLKLSPLPAQRVVGDLSDTKQVLAALRLLPRA